MRVFDYDRNRLLIFLNHLQVDYWDKHWERNWEKTKYKIKFFNKNSFICKITSSFINPNEGPILEGGCGEGIYVYYLKTMNYDVIGIDNAKNTVKRINKEMPNLNIKVGDVRQIPFPDNYFTGYWSLGVIEHSFNGYSEILREMKRVIKPKGYLFITFPYLSLFRRFKVKCHLYKYVQEDIYSDQKLINKFYQYVYNKEDVISDITKNGFELRYSEPLSGLKGFKDENFVMKFFINRFLQLLFNCTRPRFIQYMKEMIKRFLVRFSGNSILLVFQKINI